MSLGGEGVVGMKKKYMYIIGKWIGEKKLMLGSRGGERKGSGLKRREREREALHEAKVIGSIS